MAVNLNAPYEVTRQLRDSGFTAESLLGDVEHFLSAMQQTTTPNLRAQESRQELTRGLRAGGAPGTKGEAQAQIRELIYQARKTSEVFNAGELLRQALRTQGPLEQLKAADIFATALQEIDANNKIVVEGKSAEARNAILEELLPQLKAAIASGDTAAQKELGTRLAKLTLESQKDRVRALALQMQDVNKTVKGKLAILFKSGGPFLYPNSTPSDYSAMVAAGSKGKQVWQLGLGPDKHPTYVKITIDPSDVIDSQFASSSWVVAYYLVYRP